MRRLFKACGSLLILLALSGPARAATYTGIDCPDSIYTDARAINDRGDIVGNCEDASGIHGFRLRKGVFELIDFPGASTTFAAGINNLGHVVGFYSDSGGEFDKHGYVLRNGRFTTIDSPGSVYTFAQGIDDLGRIVGFYGHRDGSIRGFILDSRGYRDVVPPEAVVVTGAWAINVLRRIAGGFVDADGILHGYYLKKGKFTTIHPPGASGALAFGVNVLGHVVGGWSADPACPDCFVNAFLFNSGSDNYRILKFPGAHETVANGINDVGQIVGIYFGVDEQFHGFVRDP